VPEITNNDTKLITSRTTEKHPIRGPKVEYSGAFAPALRVLLCSASISPGAEMGLFLSGLSCGCTHGSEIQGQGVRCSMLLLRTAGHGPAAGGRCL